VVCIFQVANSLQGPECGRGVHQQPLRGPGQLAINMKSMVAFALHADRADCPECGTHIQPTTCAFSGCIWAFDGMKDGGNGPEDVSCDWTVSPDEN
jgi:hypothetical protein